ncbi:MAG: LysR family transcriptional regulator [Pseudomonadota bacterium]
MRRIPSLNWLRVFEAAAQHESFARAAEQLHMSAAAVSQQVKALEGYLEQPLFVRGAHDVQLTDAGRAFLPTVRQAIGSIELRAATLFGNGSRSPITIRATLILACSWLAARVQEFSERHPQFSVRLLSDASAPATVGDDVELSVVFGDTEPGFVERDRLFGERLYPVGCAGLVENASSPRDLLNHTLLEIADHRSGWGRLFDAYAIDAREARLMITDRTDVALALAAQGAGIALARAPATDEIVRRYHLRRCMEDVSVGGTESYYLTHRSWDDLSPGARELRDFLIHHAREVGRVEG